MSGGRHRDADRTESRERPSGNGDIQLLREISRRLPTGVAVLTASHQDMAHGATVSTVSVVSQNPLTLTASLRRGSLLTRLAIESGAFVVNVLTSRQALLADWFANPQRPAGTGQFALVDWEPQATTGVPLLRHALAHLTCRLIDHVEVGEADGLLVAEVVSGRIGPSAQPLVNFNGQLHGVEFHEVVRRQGWREPQSTVATLD